MVGSGAVIAVTDAKSALPCTVASVRTVSYEETTSADVSGVPSWKTTPSLRVKVYVSPSEETS